jgi:hypothetical protein
MVRSLSLKENIMGKTDMKNRQERELQDEELDAVSGGLVLGWDIKPQTVPVSSPTVGVGGGGGGPLVHYGYDIGRSSLS